MKVVWSAPAETALTSYSDYLHDQDPRIAKAAREDIRSKTNGLGSKPGKGRPSRWHGLRELSITRWKKIIVYREEADRIFVVAFLDARQDLKKTPPTG